ncbi:MAG: NifB/NifX family molybdenum-iron cluster-binding protein [Candidatus Marinimicrobia bacterium]|nr:NifB/NifX family molybdenum-iron cluster-binding protein [Candidatus Neomarinimicrobiota bacterium]
MKIGIASDDRTTIAQHFGRTLGFVIAEIEGGKVISEEYRPNTFSMHMQQKEHQHSEQARHGHSHSSILAALSDCQFVLARGMGRRIYDDLRGANIQSVITDQVTVDGALKAYIEGTLKDNPEKGCEH